MASFMLIARDGPQDFADVSPEDMQRIIEKYVAWGTKLEEAGKKRAGSKLRDGEGRVLRGDAGKLTITDGPFSETKENTAMAPIVRAALRAHRHAEPRRQAEFCRRLPSRQRVKTEMEDCTNDE